MITIKTKKFVNAVIEAPPSKSYTNRALIVASLANGISTIKRPLFSDDTNYMIDGLRKLGVIISKRGKDIIVIGTAGRLKPASASIFVGNAGTTMRFITTFASLSDGVTTITGDKRMLERPIQDLLEALKQLGVRSECNNGLPPVKIHGGTFNGGSIELKGNVSSQFISSILMCSPYAKKDIEIKIKGSILSKSYVDLTLDVMQNFGVHVKNLNYRRFIIKNTPRYVSKDYKIEGDASNASYFFGAAAITKGKVMVKNINPNSKQGDIKFVDLLKKMGCGVKRGRNFIQVQGRELRSVDVDMSNMPDVVPTLSVISLFAKSTTTIKNVPHLRLKETDRLKALSLELRKVGANVEELQDGLRIKRRRLQKAIIETYNDHRMAMSFAMAGLAINGIRIKNPSCVNKSFPDFWIKFEKLYKK